MSGRTPGPKKFRVGGRWYTHKKCEDGHVRKLANCDWTEQDVCSCDAPCDLYDPNRGMTATDDANQDRAVGR